MVSGLENGLQKCYRFFQSRSGFVNARMGGNTDKLMDTWPRACSLPGLALKQKARRHGVGSRLDGQIRSGLYQWLSRPSPMINFIPKLFPTAACEFSG